MNIDQTYVYRLGHGNEPERERFTERRPSQGEHQAAGKALRAEVPRASHAAFTRVDCDPVGMIEAQNRDRIEWLVPIRMTRMLASPFAFFRGSAAVMAADLSTTPLTRIDVMACGDMHVANLGLFASAERNLVFAINDFDEVHPGPWEWDLKRLAASAAVVAGFLGGDRTDAAQASYAAVRAYVTQMRRYAGLSYLEVWYDLIDNQEILDAVPPHLRPRAQALMAKARARGHLHTLDRLTERTSGHPRIIDEAPLIVHENQARDGTPVVDLVDELLRAYLRSLPDERRRLLARYRLLDCARKVVGVGSVGTGCWVLLLQGIDDADPLFLQVKEASESVLAPYVEAHMPVHNQGRRVVAGQRLIQGSPDIFLGWGRARGVYGSWRDFYVRQLADMKGGIRFTEGDRATLAGLPAYCTLCGCALALAHAKSGDAAMISGYCGKSDALPDAIARFALAYTAQTERDHLALAAAARSGRIPVATEH